ncbi:MAG: type II toxin-antitoxin system VapC family toxin [Gemmatimonadetes bacterium]|nr:type II toxin-antitoxin system VapC family toxin [Gemmatimonadota bacterium]MYB97921.1 type II toxin-antitoxin system VapC family toxin [Gemmatimonadota bacterium]MYI46854.1 type II toxin-antitoxin system VapC family toxin [Gemmatimonadota bacterium]
MSVAYLDTSALVAVLFGEPGGAALGARLGNFSQVVSSNLLEAEIRSVMHREEQVYSDDLLVGIKWILPERPLGPEFKTVLEAGYLRGADLWHLATALYLADDPKELSFVTRDRRQGAVASALGFQL